MATKKEDLSDTLTELGRLLRGHREEVWADWVDGDAEKLRHDDGEALDTSCQPSVEWGA